MDGSDRPLHAAEFRESMKMSWSVRFRLRQHAKASLWIVPLIGLALGAVFAEWTAGIDGADLLPGDWRYSATTASSVLSSVVGAMVALLGFVVTIGVLVIQQATGTLSPRYMRLWYRDRLQKAVLATFTGTFAYAFSLLRKIEPNSVPNLGVTLSGVAVSLSLLLLLIYLNRFTHNLRPVAIADIVGRLGQKVMFHGTEHIRRTRAPAGAYPPSAAPVTHVRTGRGGVLQAFDVAGLIRSAARHDCVFTLCHHIGDFVPPGATLVEVHGTKQSPDPRHTAGHIALGTERTIEQDPAFALRILVDIAIRALSPAVNDPTTAVQALNHIDTFLHAIGRAQLCNQYVLADAHGRPRLVIPGRNWDDYLQLGVTEIREYGATSLQVCRRLRALLEDLLHTQPTDRLSAVHAELILLDEAVQRNFTDPIRRAQAQTPDRQGIGSGRRSGT
ncbi:DUF2254 domain-containing protein [Streptomyces sp. NPDC090054]|uniref:DUF2254 domain-containing protein n=1 Tax=Streptomyces sp. NPDC090054 TaxID=3365933 RepID=UPI003807179F